MSIGTVTGTPDPIHGCVERWHQHLRGELAGGLDTILHEECVFFSPIVYRPQRGRDITKMYLRAAGVTLADTDFDADRNDGLASAATGPGAGKFRYVKQICDGHLAMLEFETTIEADGEQKYANGVDILTCDDEGLITEFKVMVRPLQAINAVHAQMKTMLEQLA